MSCDKERLLLYQTVAIAGVKFRIFRNQLGALLTGNPKKKGNVFCAKQILPPEARGVKCLPLIFQRPQYDVDVVRERKFVRHAELGVFGSSRKGRSDAITHSATSSNLTSHICTSGRPPKQLIQHDYLGIFQEVVELFWNV